MTSIGDPGHAAHPDVDGARRSQPMGAVDVAPEREYVNGMEFLGGVQEIGDVAGVDDSTIDQVLDNPEAAHG